jgi:ribosomal protein L11 methyltransferase
MPYPQFTFELKIFFNHDQSSAIKTKHDVIDWLPNNGVPEFVEGFMDGLDIDNEYTGPSDRDFYSELGGDLLPLSVYKYSREFLEDVKAKLENQFGDQLKLSIETIETKEWLEGWKESFKPIETTLFYVYPPWEPKSNLPKNKFHLEIEPGMAFGTGQHATTQLCLRRIERLYLDKAPIRDWRLCDVGTGTGILALAAKRLGFKSVAGSDIDPDAIIAAKNNSKMNSIFVPLWQGSTPVQGVDGIPEFAPPFDVVIANILFVVLEKIIGDLSLVTKNGGIVILSGVLVEDADTMIDHSRKFGLNILDQSASDGWSCLTLIKS